MGIRYDENRKQFQLDTPNTSYCVGIADGKYVGHLYYGKRLRPQDLRYLLRTDEAPYVPSANDRERCAFYDSFPFEYAGSGVGDYREGSIGVRTAAGQDAVMPTYASYEILPGKPMIPGLPAAFDRDGQAQTLILHLTDEALALDVDLYYTAFEDADVITRSVRVTNRAAEPIMLTKVFSASLDMENVGYEMLTLHGGWARERQIERRPIAHGKQGVGSTRGESSHQDHPFLAWMTPETTQEAGEVYAMHFVYSGNFLAQLELNQWDGIRAVMGIHPEHFAWKLESGDTFCAPEVVLTYSDHGLGRMTRTLHDFYRRHLIRSPYRDRKRPILINNWEATYFNFNTQKLLEIARTAAECGIEMLVMDDGWFGHRESDDSSLGDWFVNEEKLPGGLKVLADGINALGMKFGIWMEPEMVSPDSDLYRAHPDWAIAAVGRRGTLSRAQYVLDIGRKEVRDAVYERIYAILKSANIEYVKWDMNRQLTDLGSAALPADRQGEVSHRYMLGVYEMQERLLHDFPELLLENCSGGGARFDPGMLYYSPQIWCSDDTDAIERLGIQEGTALCYPLSAMGAHVSDCPNHLLGRIVPFATRGAVALAGTFGYELDITRISAADRAQIREQVRVYHQFNDLVREGDYYRLASYRENHLYDCYMVVSKDAAEALVTYVQVLAEPIFKSRRIRLQGLRADADYRVDAVAMTPGGAPTGEAFVHGGDLQQSAPLYGGDLLMAAGLPVERIPGDYQSRLYHLIITKA